jgi:hypothetical protein
VTVLRPVTGTVQSLTDARPVTTVVHTLDQVVGSLPIVGTVLGGDTLGTVTRPVTGLVDDTLGGVGTTVGSLPGVVDGLPPAIGGTLPAGTDPLPGAPSGPVCGSSTTPSGPTTSATGVRVAATAAEGTPAAAQRSDSARTAPAPAVRATVIAGAAQAAQDVTYGGRALLVPEGHGTGHGDGPFDGSGPGVLGGSAAGSAGAAAAVGIVGSTGGQISLAAGSRGTLSDDAVPASVVGEHDVAPD